MNNDFYSEPQEKITYHYKGKRPEKFSLNFKLLSNINKPLLFNILNVFISGLLGGIAFAIGATAYLSVSNKPLGAAIFAVGMFMIFAYGFGFYTSKLGYALKSNKSQNLSLIPLFLGNFIGAIAVGGILSITREAVAETLSKRANQVTVVQANDSPLSIIILAFFCGIIMFVITDNYKNAKNAAQRYLPLFLGCMTFLLCGFDHFVSSAFFFTISGSLNLKGLWCVLLTALGNSLGVLAIPLSHNAVKLLQKNSK